jgi:alpha-L-rhamnosidase
MKNLPRITRRTFLGASAALLAQKPLAAGVSALTTPLAPAQLRCEYAESPLGLDVRIPRLSWLLQARRRGARQSAYQVIVASSREACVVGKGDIWDSGRVASEATAHIAYAGRALQSRDRCFWKVRVWDELGVGSEWSEPTAWEMGLLNARDWQARWIGVELPDETQLTYTPPAAYLRKSFEIAQMPASARAYVTGLGFFELYVNGEKVGDEVLAPNQTNYDLRDLDQLAYPFDDKTSQRVCYRTYDIARSLRPGTNVIGAIVGNGWYNQRDRVAEGIMWYGLPRFFGQMELEQVDGTRQTIVSDGSWRATDAGPIVHNGIFTGERYDARLEMDGWSTAAFDDRAWSAATLMPAPKGRLVAQYSMPDRVIKTLAAVTSSTVRPGVTRVDFGQNLAGWVKVTAQGVRGEALTLRFFEDNDSSYGQLDTYVLKGVGEEVYEPRFTWHGFRYAELEANDRLRAGAKLEARVVHSDVRETGSFECSNDLFNQIMHNAKWAEQSNMHCGVPSDCPHRERVGYTGDWGQTSAEAVMFNFDAARFFTKWIDDIGDAQNTETGYVPHSAPYEGGGGGPLWGSALVTLPWVMYEHYGDRRVMESHYAGMRRWIEYLTTRSDEDGVIVREEPGGWNLGEWATPGKIEIPPALVSTCYLAHIAGIMAKVAELVGKADEVDYFTGVAAKAGQAVNKRFFDAQRAQYWEGRQGANAFALSCGVVPEEHKKAVFQRMVEIIVHDNNSHFDTGIFGTRITLDLLTAGDRGDVAYALMNQRTQPSFGWQLAQGATTLWENWNGESSHNHAMFGGVCQWFYRALAGINPDEQKPGFKHIVIRPYLLGDLTWVKAAYNSGHGEIRSEWSRSGSGLHMRVVIPTNCTATVWIPASDPRRVTESGRALEKSLSAGSVRTEGDHVVCEVGSGSYDFSVA